MADPVFERYKEASSKARSAMLKGRHKEALAAYQEAALLADHRALPFVSMGSVLLQMGRPQDAIAAYDQALQRAPTDPQALSGKASALLAAGRRDESADLAQQVARLEADQARERAEQKATAQAAAWTGGPERLLARAEGARRDGAAGGPRSRVWSRRRRDTSSWASSTLRSMPASAPGGLPGCSVAASPDGPHLLPARLA